ncbi:MAG: hypothetical protein J6W09_08160 [Bacteroidales bacterium]|nr:hypothetical protein [Bacteroidales bacterium]
MKTNKKSYFIPECEVIDVSIESRFMDASILTSGGSSTNQIYTEEEI